ncbi:MAG: maleylpyruvate isomerase N-terminal domain-containing protein [Acidimicrobiales bacterium]
MGPVGEVAATWSRWAGAFGRLVVGTPPHRWPGPSPCIGWTARDLVAHVVDFSATVLRERAGVARPPPFADFAEPAAPSRATRAAVQSVLEDPATPAKVAGWLDGSLSFDLPQHGWDLAVATGQDATIDAGEAEILWPRSRGRRACGTGSARTAGTDRRCRSPAIRRSSTGSSGCWAATGAGPPRVTLVPECGQGTYPPTSDRVL